METHSIFSFLNL